MTFGYTATMSRRKPESDGFGKLTLSVPEDLIYQAKVTATRVRTSLSHEVTEFLKRFVDENAEGGTLPSQEQPDRTADDKAPYTAERTE